MIDARNRAQGARLLADACRSRMIARAVRARPAAPVALLALGLAVAACAARETAPEPVDADDRITLERGPCFGACPMYTLTVWGDGRVEFDGRRFVAQEGRDTAQVPPADVARLFALADSIGFHDLPADITPANERACGGAWTDMPSATVTIERGAASHTVNHYHGCPAAPESLTRFEERIDQVAGTRRWLE